MVNRAKNQVTRPYRPWVPGITCRIRHLEKCSGFSLSSPVAASPAMPVPRAEPTQHMPRGQARAQKCQANASELIDEFCQHVSFPP